MVLHRRNHEREVLGMDRQAAAQGLQIRDFLAGIEPMQDTPVRREEQGVLLQAPFGVTFVCRGHGHGVAALAQAQCTRRNFEPAQLAHDARDGEKGHQCEKHGAKRCTPHFVDPGTQRIGLVAQYREDQGALAHADGGDQLGT